MRRRFHRAGSPVFEANDELIQSALGLESDEKKGIVIGRTLKEEQVFRLF